MIAILEVWEYMPEMAAFAYSRIKLNRWDVEFYRLREGTFQFRIDLPFIHITNTMYRVTVSNGTDPLYRSIPVVSGKVFWHKIKISDPP